MAPGSDLNGGAAAVLTALVGTMGTSAFAQVAVVAQDLERFWGERGLSKGLHARMRG